MEINISIEKKRKRGLWLVVGLLAGLLLLLCILRFSNQRYESPNDPLFLYQENLASIGIEGAWEQGLTGKGVKIGVIDTGVSAHADLNMRLIKGKSYVDENEKDYSDSRGHGTFIVGMLSARGNNKEGIAGLTKSKIVALKVYGEAPHVGVSHVAQAIRDAVDIYDCSVILLSMGTPNSSEELERAVEYATGKGAIIVAAAGGDDENPYYPAAYENVVGVASSENPVDNGSTFVTAPGEDIISLNVNGGYDRDGAGASYAAAQVAALAAMGKQKDPAMDVHAFMDLLSATVTEDETVNGYGVINATAFAAAVCK